MADNQARHRPRLQFITHATISKCSSVIQESFPPPAVHTPGLSGPAIDEQLKAKILSRLVREYRRTVEHQKNLVKEQREREMEEKLQGKFPELFTGNISPGRKAATMDGSMLATIKYHEEANRSRVRGGEEPRKKSTEKQRSRSKAKSSKQSPKRSKRLNQSPSVKVHRETAQAHLFNEVSLFNKDPSRQDIGPSAASKRKANRQAGRK